MPTVNESAYLPSSTAKLAQGPWLVLAPHPDDETFGMGGTLLLAKTANITIDVLFLTDGSAADSSDSNLAVTREREALIVCKKLGIRNTLFWREKDRELSASQHLIDRLSEFIISNQYASVFFPSPLEPHPDHRTTAVITWESLRQSQFRASPISYEISIQGHTNQLIDISSVVEKKQAVMTCYASQLSQNHYIQRIIGLNQARAWSLPLSVSHAEAFYLWPKEDRPLNALLLSIATQQSSLQALPNKVPLISVITRTQNRPGFLREAIRSVAGQTYSNLEFIVVNDGGNNCAQLVKEEAIGHIQNYIYKHLDTQSGRAHAANVGLDMCNGEFIIFLDDDDWLSPEHIEKLVHAIIKHPETKVAYTGVQCVDEYKKLLPTFFSYPFDATRLISGNYIPIHSALFSRLLLDLGCKVDESLEEYEDWDFWIQASMHTQFLFVDGFSAFYRGTGESDTGLNNSNDLKIEENSLIVFKKWLPKLQDKQLTTLSDTLRQTYIKDIQLVEKNTQLTEKDMQLVEKNTQLTEKDIQLVEKNTQLTEKDIQLEEKYQQITDRDNIITQLNHDKEQLLSSTSWRISLPLRIASHQFKRIPFILRLIKPALKHGGGLNKTIKKAIRLFRRQGFTGIRQKLKSIASSQHNYLSGKSYPILQSKIKQLAENIFSPRVLIIAEMSIPQCKKYRVTQKQQMFIGLGIECTVCNWTDYQTCISELSTHSVVIFYRVPSYPSVLNLIEEAKRLQVTSFWEVDDLIFDQGILKESKTLAEFSQTVINELIDGAASYRQAMLACDKGITSTKELAEEMYMAGVKEVFVIENALDTESLNCSNKINTANLKPIDHSIRIVYGSGTDTHNIDFKEAAIAILVILNQFPHVKLRIIGILELSSEFTSFASQIERIPFCSYDEYLLHLSECDINIAPLENYIFNEAKSNIKFIEASIVKIPSICSPRSAFVKAITPGINGFLCETSQEWANALTSLINDKTLRYKIGLAAYQSVTENYSPENIAKKQLLPIVKEPANKAAKKKLRILAVNIFYTPQPFGGATIVAEEINKSLNASGEFEMFVFTSLPDRVIPDYDTKRYEAEGVSVFGLGLPRLLSATEQFNNTNVTNPFQKVLSIVKPDIVHFHSIQGLGVSIVDLCIEKKIKYIITLHDAWWICGRQFMINNQDKYCNQQEINLSICDHCVDNASLNRTRQLKLEGILKKAELLLSPSQFFADLYLKNKIPLKQVIVNKNGVLEPKEHQKKIRNNNNITFCYVGGNTAIKGIHLIKKVFSQFTENHIKLVIVDNTTNLGYSSYDEQAFKGINNVEVIPAYTQKTIDQFFSGVDVLLFPSQWKESFGLTIREALARNVWIISTDAGGVVEDISNGTNGIIIPFDDDGTELTKAVKQTIKNFQAIKVGAEVNFKTNKITWFSDQSTELASIYKQVLNKKT